jgi:hypothetical protein
LKAIAKDNLYYPEYNYTNWLKGKSYDCWEENDLLRIVDERGVVFNFFEKTRDCLNDRFEFIEGEN